MSTKAKRKPAEQKVGDLTPAPWNPRSIFSAMDAKTVERFWHKVDKTKDGCWFWTAAKNRKGYGMFCIEGKSTRLAHRVSFAIANSRELVPGAVLDHLCRVPRCVRPDHLEEVDVVENTLRGEGISAQRARQTICKRGHNLGDAYKWRGGRHRVCKTCRAEMRKKGGY